MDTLLLMFVVLADMVKQEQDRKAWAAFQASYDAWDDLALEHDINELDARYWGDHDRHEAIDRERDEDDWYDRYLQRDREEDDARARYDREHDDDRYWDDGIYSSKYPDDDDDWMWEDMAYEDMMRVDAMMAKDDAIMDALITRIDPRPRKTDTIPYRFRRRPKWTPKRKPARDTIRYAYAYAC